VIDVDWTSPCPLAVSVAVLLHRAPLWAELCDHAAHRWCRLMGLRNQMRNLSRHGHH
jgi:hypothetical protein